VTNSIASAVEANAGDPGSLENLVVDASEVSTVVSDTIDPVTVSLSVEPSSLDNWSTGPVEFTATVDHAPQGDLVLTLSNGVEITILDGQVSGSSGSVNVTAQDDGTFEVSIDDADGGNYEDLDTTATTTITFTDTSPTADPAAATLDDDGLANGNAGGDGDVVAVDGTEADNNEATYVGMLPIALGADNASGTVDFALMDGDEAMVGTETVTYSWAAGTLTAKISDGGDRDGTDLFTVSVDNSGEFTVTLLENVMHETLDGMAGDNTENDVLDLALTYTVTDADGSTANSTLTLNLNDDTPTVTFTSESSDPAIVTESGGVATASLQLSSVINAGADGLAGDASYTLQLRDELGEPLADGVEVASGLFTAESGGTDEIMLAKVGDDIVGTVDNGATEVFRIEIGSGGGGQINVTMQAVGLYHAQGGDDPLYLNGVNLVAVATVIDADGDEASSTVDLASLIGFADSTPVIGSVTDATIDNEVNLTVTGTVEATAVDTVTGFTLESNGATGPYPGMVYTYSEDGSTMTATDGTNETVFTMTVNPDGTYLYTLFKIAPETLAITPDFDTLTIPNHTTEFTIDLFESYGPGGVGIGDPVGTVTFAVGNPATQSFTASQDGLGINNNLINSGGEKLLMTFDSAVSNATFAIGNFKTSDDLIWRVYDENDVQIDFGVIQGSFFAPDGVTVVTVTNSESPNYIIDLAANGMDVPNFYSMSLEGAAAGSESYKFTGFSVEKAITVDDQNYPIQVQAIDGDGDLSAAETINITVDGTGNVLTSTSSDEALAGGSGVDVFKWSLGDTGSDVVTDFTAAAPDSIGGGDVLDLSDLLNLPVDDAADLAGYLSLTPSGSDTVINVDPTGGGSPSQTIKLEGVSLAELQSYTGATDGLDILKQLIDNGNLKTDS
jgi:hypothetical protein